MADLFGGTIIKTEEEYERELSRWLEEEFYKGNVTKTQIDIILNNVETYRSAGTPVEERPYFDALSVPEGLEFEEEAQAIEMQALRKGYYANQFKAQWKEYQRGQALAQTQEQQKALFNVRRMNEARLEKGAPKTATEAAWRERMRAQDIAEFGERKAEVLKRLPTARGIYGEALTKGIAALPESMRKQATEYFERQIPRIYEEASMGEKRQAWFDAIYDAERFARSQRLGRSQEAIRGHIGGVQEAISGAYQDSGLIPMSGAPFREAETELGRVTGQRERLERRGERAEEKIDPWAALTQKYPFLKKFLGLSPRERGEYPSQFAQPARWRW